MVWNSYLAFLSLSASQDRASLQSKMSLVRWDGGGFFFLGLVVGQRFFPPTSVCFLALPLISFSPPPPPPILTSVVFISEVLIGCFLAILLAVSRLYCIRPAGTNTCMHACTSKHLLGLVIRATVPSKCGFSLPCKRCGPSWFLFQCLIQLPFLTQARTSNGYLKSPGDMLHLNAVDSFFNFGMTTCVCSETKYGIACHIA